MPKQMPQDCANLPQLKNDSQTLPSPLSSSLENVNTWVDSSLIDYLWALCFFCVWKCGVVNPYSHRAYRIESCFCQPKFTQPHKKTISLCFSTGILTNRAPMASVVINVSHCLIRVFASEFFGPAFITNQCNDRGNI